MATKASTPKRAPEGMDRIRAAVAAVAAKGKEPSLRTVRAELTRNGRPGASFTYIVAVLKEWRAQTLPVYPAELRMPWLRYSHWKRTSNGTP